MKLALFDLDHTLIPFDSGMAWTRFLVARGVLAPRAEDDYLAYCQAYLAGTLDIHAMHRASLAPLAAHTRSELARWVLEFEVAMRARLPAERLALVKRHRDAGDVCAIVTATDRFIAEPFARLFGVPHVVATEAVWRDGVPSGEIDGLPCFREHKVTRVQQWLARARPGGAGTFAAFEQSWFYSDSASDLPLLSAVSNPVAVRPDARLHQHALRAGWPIVDPA
ncbi:MAG TPA: HAD family phosphatase [Burkholderiaceae bacterium]|nr:HAD family phosphatase [Burkholderiaceae bacterium]